MNKDLNTLYNNRNAGFDLSEFRVIARKPDKEISKKLKLAIIMYGISIIITITSLTMVIQSFATWVYQANHQQVGDEINPNNPVGLNPLTGERLLKQ